MGMFKGENVLRPQPRFKIIVLVLAGIILLGLILLFMQTGHKTLGMATFDNYKVKLVYQVTWDNYCLKPQLEVTSLKDNSRTAIPARSYEGPCGQDHSASFWMYADDFNHDGHKDFAILSVYDQSGNTGGPAYSEFIYTPSAPASLPFVQQ